MGRRLGPCVKRAVTHTKGALGAGWRTGPPCVTLTLTHASQLCSPFHNAKTSLLLSATAKQAAPAACTQAAICTQEAVPLGFESWGLQHLWREHLSLLPSVPGSTRPHREDLNTFLCLGTPDLMRVGEAKGVTSTVPAMAGPHFPDSLLLGCWQVTQAQPTRCTLRLWLGGCLLPGRALAPGLQAQMTGGFRARAPGAAGADTRRETPCQACTLLTTSPSLSSTTWFLFHLVFKIFFLYF